MNILKEQDLFKINKNKYLILLNIFRYSVAIFKGTFYFTKVFNYCLVKFVLKN